MMKIVFDLLAAQSIGDTQYHGGGEYAKVVFRRLLELAGENQIIVFFDKTRFLDNWILDAIKSRGIKVYNTLGLRKLDDIVRIENPDVLFFPLFMGLPKLYHGSAIKVGVVHDLRELELNIDRYILLEQHGISFFKTLGGYLCPSLYLAWRKWEIRRRIACLDRMVTVSAYSQQMIKKVCAWDQDRIKVFFSPRMLKQVTDIPCHEFNSLKLGKYILFLSANRFVKNPYRAVQAIEELLEQQKLEEYKVVMTGTPSKHVRKLMKHGERYVILGYVSREFLENLYSHCDIFLYASLSEGFGYPPLEAMRYGKTCVVSATSSIPEVCGSVVYYFDPVNVHSIAAGIMQAVKTKIDPELIRAHLDNVSKRQDEDLDKLCHLILAGR